MVVEPLVLLWLKSSGMVFLQSKGLLTKLWFQTRDLLNITVPHNGLTRLPTRFVHNLVNDPLPGLPCLEWWGGREQNSIKSQTTLLRQYRLVITTAWSGKQPCRVLMSYVEPPLGTCTFGPFLYYRPSEKMHPSTFTLVGSPPQDQQLP